MVLYQRVETTGRTLEAKRRTVAACGDALQVRALLPLV
jgi:hypothetical protein